MNTDVGFSLAEFNIFPKPLSAFFKNYLVMSC